MATQFPESSLVSLVDPVELAINQSFDSLIKSLEERRTHLLSTLSQKRGEMRDDELAFQQVKQQLAKSRGLIEGELKHNLLHSMRERIVADMECKNAELQARLPPPQELAFVCDTKQLNELIYLLGQIVLVDIPTSPPVQAIPNYSAFHQPILAVGKRGTAPGEFDSPRNISIETESGHIYVTDCNNSRIQLFSSTGEYLNQFGDQHLKWPCGILNHLDNIYVTDTWHHNLSQFKLPELNMIKQVGRRGSGNEEFISPSQLAISPNNLLYVADQANNRLQILTSSLSFRGTLQHQTMKRPVDVKFTQKEIFVLTYKNSTIHVFTLSGRKSRTIVTRNGMQDLKACSFCLDGQNNLIISDSIAHNIKVYSPDGALLHTIGEEGHEAGMFHYPRGIAILNSTKLVCVSHNKNFRLQIFSA